jgi:hypothetical protein
MGHHPKIIILEGAENSKDGGNQQIFKISVFTLKSWVIGFWRFKLNGQ